jgi:hypothetical protein
MNLHNLLFAVSLPLLGGKKRQWCTDMTQQVGAFLAIFVTKTSTSINYFASKAWALDLSV